MLILQHLISLYVVCLKAATTGIYTRRTEELYHCLHLHPYWMLCSLLFCLRLSTCVWICSWHCSFLFVPALVLFFVRGLIVTLSTMLSVGSKSYVLVSFPSPSGAEGLLPHPNRGNHTTRRNGDLSFRFSTPSERVEEATQKAGRRREGCPKMSFLISTFPKIFLS